jgi:uncharacterized membrane protein YkoI
MNYRVKIVLGIATAAAIAGVAAGGGALAADSGDADGSDTTLSGTALDRAGEAALAETGGGVVVSGEAEGEGTYEVDVELADGRQIEVQLDAAFAVVSSEADAEGGDGDAG